MTVKIGEKEYATRRPRDLDRVLVAETGCNAGEFARMLNGQPLAVTVARALFPFLSEEGAPSLAELAAEIEAAGTMDAAARVAGLYAAAGADDLDDLTVPKLREVAAAETIDLGDAARRDDILAVIRRERLARRTAPGGGE